MPLSNTSGASASRCKKKKPRERASQRGDSPVYRWKRGNTRRRHRTPTCLPWPISSPKRPRLSRRFSQILPKKHTHPHPSISCISRLTHMIALMQKSVYLTHSIRRSSWAAPEPCVFTTAILDHRGDKTATKSFAKPREPRNNCPERTKRLSRKVDGKRRFRGFVRPKTGGRERRARTRGVLRGILYLRQIRPR